MQALLYGDGAQEPNAHEVAACVAGSILTAPVVAVNRDTSHR